MPSGSHGSSGGGHSGGGSSGGSHIGGGRGSVGGGSPNRGAPHRGEMHNRHFGPRVFVFGRRRYVVEGNSLTILYALMVVILIGIFFVFSGCLTVSGGQKSISTIKDDYTRYQQMIVNAQSNDEYKIKAVVTDSFRHESGKYYITYAFPLVSMGESELYSNYLDDLRNNALQSRWVEGYSYSVYSLEQVSSTALQKGSVILLAINDKLSDINSLTDSIPFDYYQMSLNADGEYLMAQDYVKEGVMILVIGIVMIVGAIAGAIVIIKRSKQEKAKTLTANTTQSVEDKGSSTQRCAYCGTKVKNGETKCPNCSARL